MIRPESGPTTPAIILSRVDLPAPLRPTNPTRPSSFIVQLTESRMTRPPNDLDRLSSASTGLATFHERQTFNLSRSQPGQESAPRMAKPPRRCQHWPVSQHRKGEVSRWKPNCCSKCRSN